MVRRIAVQIRVAGGHDHGSGILPLRRALHDEGTDALLGTLRQHVVHHHLSGTGIGLCQRHFALRIKGTLACRQRDAGLGSGLVRHFAGGLLQCVLADHAVHKTDFCGARGC